MNPNSPTTNKQLIDELTSKFNNVTANDQKQKSPNNRPACGVKARNLKNNNKFLANFINLNKKTAAAAATGSAVNNFPCCSSTNPTAEVVEYDTPWSESKFAANLTNAKCQLSCKSIGSQGSGTDDSGIYEPPWDGNLLQKLAQNSSNQIQLQQNRSFFDICNEKAIAFQKSSHSSSRSSSTKSSKSQQLENCQISRNLLVEKLCDETLKQQQHIFSSTKGTLINVPLIRSVSNCSSPNSRNLRPSNVFEEVYDVPWEVSCNKRDFEEKCDALSRPNSKNPSPIDRTTRLSNGSDRSLKECRKHRKLTERVELSSLSDWINAKTSLEDEDWYHGNINRQEAESRLQNYSNGSYLIRCCEILDDRYQQELQQQQRPEYALSLKSPQGYLHMKIQLNAKHKWILGYYSYPFDSISNMISYYTINKLPVKGADHICLLKPVVKG